MVKRRSSSHPTEYQESQIESAQAGYGAAEPSFTPPPRPTRENERIGDILRRVREHRHEDIESVSDYLRIKPGYLIALEESQYDELPADAYVIGFLRTYALYLGLDGRGAIDQYRREMAGRRRKPQLSMPQPVSEGRAPTMALLAGAAAACVILYGLWYGLSTPEDKVLQQAVPLPLVQSGPVLANETVEPIGASESLISSSTSEGIALTATGNDVVVMPPDSQEKKAPVSEAGDEQGPSSVKPAAKTEAKTISEEVLPSKIEEKLAEKALLKQETEAPSVESKTEKTIYGASSVRSRVLVRATEESWILITDEKGLTVFDRNLKPGETYSVPDGKGLRLTTGNASGIVFVVDGARLAEKSSSRRVVRAISLDPEKLKSRLTAASDNVAPKNEE